MSPYKTVHNFILSPAYTCTYCQLYMFIPTCNVTYCQLYIQVLTFLYTYLMTPVHTFCHLYILSATCRTYFKVNCSYLLQQNIPIAIATFTYLLLVRSRCSESSIALDTCTYLLLPVHTYCHYAYLLQLLLTNS